MIKILNKVGLGRYFHSMVKIHFSHKKLMLSLSEKSKAFPLKLRRQRYSLLYYDTMIMYLTLLYLQINEIF